MKESWLFLCGGAVKNLKKKRNEDDCEFWMVLMKGSFIAYFEDWHHQNWNFTLSKMPVSRIL